MELYLVKYYTQKDDAFKTEYVYAYTPYAAIDYVVNYLGGFVSIKKTSEPDVTMGNPFHFKLAVGE
jgi:hypothetical protein